MKHNELQKFGEFIIHNLFDKGIECYTQLSENQLKSPLTKQLRNDIKELNEEQLALMRKVVFEVMTTAMHDFLFALQERNDLENDISINVDEINIAEESDGLHGEIFTDEGWIKIYSAYSNEIED